MQLVNEPCAEVLLDSGDAPADPNISVVGSLFRALQRRLDSIAYEVERRPSLIPRALILRGSETGRRKAYALLLEAMKNEGYWGIARIGMHKREHMLILRPTADYMTAHTMFYVNEIKPVPEFTIDRSTVVEKELSIARTLIRAYSGEFQPEAFKDIYQERIKGIIDSRVADAEQASTSAAVSSERLVPNLLESIKLSLAQAPSKRSEVGITCDSPYLNRPVTQICLPRILRRSSEIRVFQKAAHISPASSSSKPSWASGKWTAKLRAGENRRKFGLQRCPVTN